jgi:hypothetical protein
MAKLENDDRPSDLIQYSKPPPFDRPEQKDNFQTNCHFVIKNLRDSTTWFQPRDFWFDDLLSCDTLEVCDPLAPGEERHCVGQFSVNKCDHLEAKRERLAEARNGVLLSRKKKVHPLKEDTMLYYSFDIDAWDVSPFGEEWFRPQQTVRIEGRMIIPAGTPSDFCIHHRVDKVDVPAIAVSSE